MTTDGLGFEEVNQAVTSTAVISGTNVYGATSVQSATISGTTIYATTSFTTPTISGTNVFAAGSVQADKVVADVMVSGLNVYSTGSVDAGRVFGDVMVSGNNVYANASVTGDTVIGATHVSGLNVFATGSVEAGRVFGDVMISGAQVYSTGDIQGSNISEAGVHRMPRTALNGSPTAWTQTTTLRATGETGAGSKLDVVFGTPFFDAPIVSVNAGSGALGTSFGLIYTQAGSFGVESSDPSKLFAWKADGNPV